MLKQIVAPTYDLLLDTKSYLRILDNDNDILLSSLIDTAFEYAQDYTNRALKTTTYEWILSSIYDGIRLPKNPIQSILKIEIRNSDGTYIVFDEAKYYLYEQNGIGCICFEELPELLNHKLAVKITFVAGYENIPKPIESWIKYSVSLQFDGENFNKSKFVDSILDQYRIRSI